MARYERLVEVDLRHDEICNLNTTHAHYEEVRRFFSSIMEFAPANVLELSSKCMSILHSGSEAFTQHDISLHSQ